MDLSRIAKLLFCLSATCLLPFEGLHGQVDDQDFPMPPPQGIRTMANVVDRDTFPLVQLENVDVLTTALFKTRKQYEQWTRVKYNVKKVYPYAILASVKLKEYDRTLSAIHNEALRKAFLRQCERDLRAEFEEELKSLSYSQGRVLMKLIDRETGKTTYEIVKQLRGGFQAGMWQAVARVFGHNMKAEYEASGEDQMIERAIHLVETGVF